VVSSRLRSASTSKSTTIEEPHARAAMMRVFFAVVLALPMLGRANVVQAHQQGVTYSDVAVADGRVRYDLTIPYHDMPELDVDRDGALEDAEVVAQYPRLRRQLERAIVVQAGD